MLTIDKTNYNNERSESQHFQAQDAALVQKEVMLLPVRRVYKTAANLENVSVKQNIPSKHFAVYVV